MDNKYFEKFKNVATQKGGKCLSCIYKNNSTPLKWICKRGHIWKMQPAYVADGSWCKKCKKIDILHGMKKYAKRRGGQCLSKQFVNSKTKLLWECANGHLWYSNSAKYNNSWCPRCCNIFFISEEKCRFILETVLGEHFHKTRQALKDRLELDGYCEKLKLAFEYQGQQHFEDIDYYNSIPLNKRKSLDLKKKILCNKKKILLLEIPYYVNTSDLALFQYIVEKLKKNKIKLVTETIDWDNFVSQPPILATLANIAHQKKGKLLSNSYRGYFSKLEFQCHKNHKWFTIPGNIKLGTWCPKCNARAISFRNRNSISDVQILATKNKSTLISNTYESNITPIAWKCNICQNSWIATLNCMKTRLLKKYWCLFCKRA